ncbi:oligosaccharide flippase family protein [Neomoorella humiferrea]|uniref:oligosaccharide flippase family protein n=1 Tax=Neomoorella humiferrea TaxID=676965 RepID=UPI003D9292A5
MKTEFILKTYLPQLFRHPLAKNALALYAVQIANYIFPLITIPYLTRILRPEGWGLVIFAQSFAIWLSLILEYGFNLSATRDISRNRLDLCHISQIVEGVMGAKSLLLLGTVLVTLVAGTATPLFRQYPDYLWLAWLSAIAQGLNPLWYFQGLERLYQPAILSVAARFLSVILIFILIRDAGDGWMVLALHAGAGFFATVISIIWMYREVPFRWPLFSQAINALRMGWSMFFFCSTVSLYTTANAFILGFFVPPALVGLYGGAEKISKSVLSLLNPISQALYPRMNHLVANDSKRAANLAYLSLLFMGGLGFILSALIIVTAPTIVKILLGPGFEGSIPVLRLLSLLIPLIALSNVLGIQWMVPLGLDRTFNIIIMTAGLINLALAFLFAPRFGPMGMGEAVVLSETFVTSSMFLVLWKKKLNPFGGIKNES